MSRTKSTQKTPFQLYILNAVALAGASISVALTQHFYDVHNGTSGFKSFCNVSQAMNCDVIAASPQAELIWGLPLSSFAAGWFLALFFVSVIAHNIYWRRETLRASLGLSMVGTLAAIPYLLIMALQLKTYCVLCFAVDALNLAALILVLSLKPERFFPHKPDLSKWKIIFPIILGSVFASVIGLRSLDNYSMPASDITELSEGVLNTPVVSLKTDSSLPSIGPLGAPITIVEFSDFQCPFCRIGAYAVNSVLNRYPGKVRVIFRNFPLNQECNPSIQQTAHPAACEAARAAYCAQKHGKFEPAYQDLFEKQASLSPGRPFLIVQALGLGIDGPQLQSCMMSPEVATAIIKDVEDATVLGVKSTPTFFINGHKMEGAYPVPVWNKIIDKLLTHEPH